MSAAMSGSAQTVDRKAEWETRLDHAAEEILDVLQDRFFWHRISDIANANQVVRDNPFVPSFIGTLFYRRAIVAVRTIVDAGQRGREHDTDYLVSVLNDIIAHPQDLVVGAHSVRSWSAGIPSTRLQSEPMSPGSSKRLRRSRDTRTST